MAEIVSTVTECVPIPGTDRTRISFAGEAGAYSFEFTQAAVEALMPGVIAQPPVVGQATSVANAISPIGCQPFESLQGLCGLAFSLGDRSLHVAVPANGIETVRTSLDVIEIAYRNQKMPRMPR